MDKNLFIFRNYTIEPLFNSFSGCKFSGYSNLDFIDGYKYYIWLYTIPIKPNHVIIANEINFYRKNLQFIAKKLPATNTLICFTISEVDNFSFTHDYSIVNAISKYNSTIYELAENNKNIKVVDFKSFTTKYKSSELIDYRHFYMSQVPINPKFSNDFGEWFKHKINAIESIRKKCLILDLDNTLWGGILGEDGISGIKLGNTYPGNCFSDFQSYIKEIKNTGVILAICSKNNLVDVDQVFEKRDDMILNVDDFAAVRINWQNKVDNIKELALELNIGTDSMVFIDDSPFEREQVQTMLPEVVVPLFPKQPYLLVDFIKEVYNSWFQTYELTAEDAIKTEQYQQNTKRQEAISTRGNMEDFIKEMEIELTISESNQVHIPRIAQMTQKTNQFNLTTIRYTETEISNMLEKGTVIWDAAVSDKFGDSGITALAIVRVEKSSAIIESFLLSCRVLGRGIETTFLNYILNQLFDRGIINISASFSPTSKNMQVSSFYDNSGFTLISPANSLEKKYTLELSEKRY